MGFVISQIIASTALDGEAEPGGKAEHIPLESETCPTTPDIALDGAGVTGRGSRFEVAVNGAPTSRCLASHRPPRSRPRPTIGLWGVSHGIHSPYRPAVYSGRPEVTGITPTSIGGIRLAARMKRRSAPITARSVVRFVAQERDVAVEIVTMDESAPPDLGGPQAVGTDLHEELAAAEAEQRREIRNLEEDGSHGRSLSVTNRYDRPRKDVSAPTEIGRDVLGDNCPSLSLSPLEPLLERLLGPLTITRVSNAQGVQGFFGERDEGATRIGLTRNLRKVSTKARIAIFVDIIDRKMRRKLAFKR